MKSLKLFSGILLLASVPSVIADVTITGQPRNASVSLGASVQFSVAATSTAPPITYQWRFNNVPLDLGTNPSAATARFSRTSVTLAADGPYSVLLTDLDGSVTSQVATLTVDPTFTKITTGPVVSDLGLWSAPTWWDYDNDGFPDLYVANATVTSEVVRDALYHNDTDGTFTRVTNNALGTRFSRSIVGAAGDYNNDGFDDLLATHFDPSTNIADDLYRNDGGGVFTLLTQSQAGPPVADADNSVDAGWADYDRDGFIDLFVANAWKAPGKDRFYHNNRDGTFTTMTASQPGSLLESNSTSGPCAWVDYDNDGYPDLWVGRAIGENSPTGRQDLYHNHRDGTFSKVLAGSLTNNLAAGAGRDRAGARQRARQRVPHRLGTARSEGLARAERRVRTGDHGRTPLRLASPVFRRSADMADTDHGDERRRHVRLQRSCFGRANQSVLSRRGRIERA